MVCRGKVKDVNVLEQKLADLFSVYEIRKEKKKLWYSGRQGSQQNLVK